MSVFGAKDLDIVSEKKKTIQYYYQPYIKIIFYIKKTTF